MYFPYLRGRQYELIALRELAEKQRLSKNVFPIIEPVSPSSTLISTVKKLISSNLNVGFIINPHVGSVGKDKEDRVKECIELAFEATPFFIVDDDIRDWVRIAKTPLNECGFIFNKRDAVQKYLDLVSDSLAQPLFNVIPDESFYRRSIHSSRVLLNDPFEIKQRNSDYSDDAELFSEDHLYYKDDGFVGFSDYLTIGDKYTESGFLPYCVVIHITFFDKKNRLMIKHFKSDSIGDTNDTAKKFYEAVSKFVEWNKEHKLNTYAANELERLHRNGLYPGLGTIKKLSLMNHIELIDSFLNNENK